MTALTPAGPARRTGLYQRHLELGAKMTAFHGWEMPLYYTSIIEEHRAVREVFGIFDVSHMGQVLVTGPEALPTLNRLVVSDLGHLGEGRACYTLLLNEHGGILDDVIVFRLGPEDFLVIVNCATHEADVAWLQAHQQGRVTMTDISEGRAILAVQGPKACRTLEQLLDTRVTTLGRFGVAPIRTMGPDACLARTGYTGGDGFELFLPNTHAVRVWNLVVNAGQGLGGLPVGLGARDTLRVEAGLRLYGADMDAQTTPWEAGLGWTVAMQKGEFIGREALVRQREVGIPRVFIGIQLASGPVPRQGMELRLGDRRVGTVTSGTYSPLLQQPIGMGYVEPTAAKLGTRLTVTVRSQRYEATIVKLPFWTPRMTPAARLTAGASPLESRT